MNYSAKVKKILEESYGKYNNNPELIKIVLDLLGKEGHRKIQSSLFKDLIAQYALLHEKLKDKLEYITHISETDPLTKIYNRIKFMKELNKEISNLKKNKTELSIIMFDIDHFKKINDIYGHDVGDLILIELTCLIKTLISEKDTFTRWGGEEFMILLPNRTLSEITILAENLRDKIEHNNFSKVEKVTCSFGATIFINDLDEINSFIKRVDNGLYRAKNSGRNKVIII